MNPRLRRRRALVGAAAVLAIGLLSACGSGGTERPATTTPASSATLTPTNKVRPGGPNNFTPTPIAPLNPTGAPGQSGTAPH